MMVQSPSLYTSSTCDSEDGPGAGVADLILLRDGMMSCLDQEYVEEVESKAELGMDTTKFMCVISCLM